MNHLSQGARRFATIGAASVIALLVVAGCSSSGKSGGNAASSTTAGTTSAGSSSGNTATSGTIDIGFANENTGTVAFPAITQGAQAAAKWVNAHGGLGGKSINLIVCDMKKTTQGAQECGQQFANDSKMPFAMMGLTFDGGPFYAAMNAANKPILGGIGITPADYSPSDTFFYYPGSTYYYGVANWIKSKGWKSVSYIYENTAATIAGEQTVASLLKGTGITIKGTAVPEGAADLTAQIASAGIGDADGLVVETNACSEVSSAMKSLNITAKSVLTVNSCLPPQVLAANPSLYEGWVIASSTKLALAGASGDSDTATFLQGWDKYGPGGPVGSFGEMGWGMVLTAAKVFPNATTITSQSALTALKSYTGPIVMGPDTIKCPGAAPYTATCATDVIYYKVTNGKLVITHI